MKYIYFCKFLFTVLIRHRSSWRIYYITHTGQSRSSTSTTITTFLSILGIKLKVRSVENKNSATELPYTPSQKVIFTFLYEEIK